MLRTRAIKVIQRKVEQVFDQYQREHYLGNAVLDTDCTAKVKKIGSRRAPAVFSRRCGTVDILKVRRDGGTILTLARCGSDELEIGALIKKFLFFGAS